MAGDIVDRHLPVQFATKNAGTPCEMNGHICSYNYWTLPNWPRASGKSNRVNSLMWCWWIWKRVKFEFWGQSYLVFLNWLVSWIDLIHPKWPCAKLGNQWNVCLANTSIMTRNDNKFLYCYVGSTATWPLERQCANSFVLFSILWHCQSAKAMVTEVERV